MDVGECNTLLGSILRKIMEGQEKSIFKLKEGHVGGCDFPVADVIRKVE